MPWKAGGYCDRLNLFNPYPIIVSSAAAVLLLLLSFCVELEFPDSAIQLSTLGEGKC